MFPIISGEYDESLVIKMRIYYSGNKEFILIKVVNLRNCINKCEKEKESRSGLE
jgi:hypothetical protein